MIDITIVQLGGGLAAIGAVIGGPWAAWKVVQGYFCGEIAEAENKLRTEFQADDRLLRRDVDQNHLILDKEIVHNRSNADTKFVAVETKLDRNTSDIVMLGKADVEHTVAIKHLETTISNGFSDVKGLIHDMRRTLKSE